MSKCMTELELSISASWKLTWAVPVATFVKKKGCLPYQTMDGFAKGSFGVSSPCPVCNMTHNLKSHPCTNIFTQYTRVASNLKRLLISWMWLLDE